MVDAHLRSKTIETADIKNLIIGGQTGIDGIRFCLAAVTNGENLADPAFSWFLQYKNKNGQGESVGLTPVYENGLVKLPWIPNSLATQVSGRMQIQLYAAIVTGEGEAAVVDKQWVSEFAIIYIQENINPDPIVATEPSVIEYYVTLYAAYKNAAEAAAAAALESEQAAGTSEDNAADSAYAAEQAAIAAGDSASSAAQSAGLANTSKNAAAGSASEAAGSAAGALASKQAAATSETNAADHATEALASKNAAGVSEGNASDSKLKAQKWAEEAKDVEVEPGKFSAKHWMEKASGVYDNFDARFLGYKDADPALDNKGNALVQGALYFNSVSKMLRLYNGTAWGDLANSAAGITYSGAGSGLEGTNVQTAIDELNEKKAAKESVEVLQLATARQETRANELEKILNSTQGTTFDTTDIGTVQLPPNAAGRALANLRGGTAKNLIVNGDFSQGATGWSGVGGVLSEASRILSIIGNGTESILMVYNSGMSGIRASIGDKVLIFTRAKINAAAIAAYFQGLEGIGTIRMLGIPLVIIPDGFSVYLQVATLTDNYTNFRIGLRTNYVDNTAANGKVVQIDGDYGVMAINLTNHFGAGNEPPLADCKRYFSTYFSDAQSVYGPMRLLGRGKNFFDKSNTIAGYYFTSTGALQSIDTGFYSPNYIPILPSTTYRASLSTNLAIAEYDKNRVFIGRITTASFITSPKTKYLRISCSSGDYETFQLELGSTATAYEPYKSSTLYISNNDEYRSLPSARDEIVVQDGEYWRKQNVQKYVLQASDIVSLYTVNVNNDLIGIKKPLDSINYGNTTAVWSFTIGSYGFFSGTSDNTASIGKVRTDGNTGNYELAIGNNTYGNLAAAQAALAGTVIYYQLVTPIYTRLDTLGNLLSLRSVTFEPWYQHSYQTDTSGQIALPFTGAIDKVYGYDDELQEYEVPSTGYSLDGTTLTIAGSEEGEVWYVLMVRTYEQPIPQITINSINSKTTIKDTTNGKFYELVPIITNGVLVGQNPMEVI